MKLFYDRAKVIILKSFICFFFGLDYILTSIKYGHYIYRIKKSFRKCLINQKPGSITDHQLASDYYDMFLRLS